MSIRLIKPLVLGLIAALAAGAIGATAAQATESEGPALLLEEEVQGAGQTTEVTGADKTAFVLKNSIANIKVECTGLKLKAGSTLSGAEAKVAGAGHATLELSACKGGSTGGGLSGCEPEEGKLSTVALTATLGYSSEARTGDLLMLVAPETGTTLASVKFSGEKCASKSATLTGKLIAKVESEGKAIEAGKNEVEAVKNELAFAAGEQTIWIESAGSLSSSKSSLSAFGSEATLEGQATLELANKESWGWFVTTELYPRAYSFGPASVLFTETAGQERLFTIDDRGTEDLELRNVKVGGGEASKYQVNDKNSCLIKTFIILGHCNLTIKLLVANAGAASLEGLVLFGGGVGPGDHRAFRAKGLIND
jgi:hypothetical protein